MTPILALLPFVGIAFGLPWPVALGAAWLLALLGLLREAERAPVEPDTPLA